MSNLTTEKIIGLINDGIEHFDELEQKNYAVGLSYANFSQVLEAQIGKKTLLQLRGLIEAEAHNEML